MAPLPHPDRRQDLSGFDQRPERGNSSSADRYQSQGVEQGPGIWQGQGFAPPGYVPAGFDQWDEQGDSSSAIDEPSQGAEKSPRVWRGQGFAPSGYVPPRSARGRGGASQRGSGFTSTRGGAASRSRGQLGPRAGPLRGRTFLAGLTTPARGGFVARSSGQLAPRDRPLRGRGSLAGPTTPPGSHWVSNPHGQGMVRRDWSDCGSGLSVRSPPSHFGDGLRSLSPGQSSWDLEEQERLRNLHLDPQTENSWFMEYQANEKNQLPEDSVAAASTNPSSHVHKRKRSQSATTAQGHHDRAEEHAVNKKQRSGGDFVMNLPIRAAHATLVTGVSDGPAEQENQVEGDKPEIMQAGSEPETASTPRHQASSELEPLSWDDYPASMGI